MKNRKFAAFALAAAVGAAAAIPAAACCDGGCCQCGTQSSGDYWSWKYARIAEEAAAREARANQLAPTPTEELDSSVAKVLVYQSEHLSVSLYASPRIEGERIVIPVAVVADRSFRLRSDRITVDGIERDFLLHDSQSVTEGTWYTVYDGYCVLFEQDSDLLFIGGEVAGEMHVRFTLEINGEKVNMDYQWDGAAWNRVELIVRTQEGR